jgi:hypothetical protein
MKSTGGRLSNYALDKFVAPKMSELTECSIRDMSNYSSQSVHWLSNFVSNSIFGPRVEPKPMQYAFFFLRRVEAAFREYDSARCALYDYLSGERERVSVYFKALFHFETCIAQIWQAYDQTMSFWKRETGEKNKIFEPGDGSVYERLNKLYNDSRHAVDNIPEDSTVPVWLTNTGIEAKENSISFAELADLLREIGDCADTISNPRVPPRNEVSSTRKDKR